MRIIEVDDAVSLAADLFYRGFRQPLPDFPRHFLLVCERPGEVLFVLGYVHHTVFESGYLAGGLVVDAWKFRALAEAEKQEIRRRGGMAEWLMADSCRLLQPCTAVFAYIGDAKSLTVNTRVGFIATGHQHLYVLPSAATPTAALEALTTQIAGVGPF